MSWQFLRPSFSASFIFREVNTLLVPNCLASLKSKAHKMHIMRIVATSLILANQMYRKQSDKIHWMWPLIGEKTQIDFCLIFFPMCKMRILYYKVIVDSLLATCSTLSLIRITFLAPIPGSSRPIWKSGKIVSVSFIVEVAYWQYLVDNHNQLMTSHQGVTKQSVSLDNDLHKSLCDDLMLIFFCLLDFDDTWCVFFP